MTADMSLFMPTCNIVKTLFLKLLFGIQVQTYLWTLYLPIYTNYLVCIVTRNVILYFHKLESLQIIYVYDYIFFRQNPKTLNNIPF